MLERGLKFGMIDLYKSDAVNFVIEGDTLIAPFRAVPSLGTNVAKQIVEARKDGPFLIQRRLGNSWESLEDIDRVYDRKWCLERFYLLKINYRYLICYKSQRKMK